MAHASHELRHQGHAKDCEFVANDRRTNHFFVVDYFIGTCDVKNELVKYAAVRPNVETKTLEQYISYCCHYANDIYNVVSVPEFLLPSIYPWDFDNVFLPYNCHVETGETKENSHNYPE